MTAKTCLILLLVVMLAIDMSKSSYARRRRRYVRRRRRRYDAVRLWSLSLWWNKKYLTLHFEEVDWRKIKNVDYNVDRWSAIKTSFISGLTFFSWFTGIWRRWVCCSHDVSRRYRIKTVDPVWELSKFTFISKIFRWKKLISIGQFDITNDRSMLARISFLKFEVLSSDQSRDLFQMHLLSFQILDAYLQIDMSDWIAQ